MSESTTWSPMAEAVSAASAAILNDREPLNAQERVDGQRYVGRILRAVTEASLIDLDFDRPAFLPMLDSVRHLGAAGPDIDYDVALLVGGVPYRIEGLRGGAAYVGIVVYGGVAGTSTILESVDVDTLIDGAGRFSFEIDHPDASRVIVRQYFHDRETQRPGAWTIERTDVSGSPQTPSSPPDPDIVAHQIANAARMLRWNAELNDLWTPERRNHPHEFVQQSAEEIAAAIPNPDVTYSFTWWRLAEGQALVIDAQPPECRYWSVQVCDRWFQSYPQRRSTLNDSQIDRRSDGSVRIVLAERDPGDVNWVDTGGHSTGVIFFRWLHARPSAEPTCHLVATVQPA